MSDHLLAMLAKRDQHIARLTRRTKQDAPDLIALRWEPGAAVTNDPLMENPDYTRYVREDEHLRIVRQRDAAIRLLESMMRELWGDA